MIRKSKYPCFYCTLYATESRNVHWCPEGLGDNGTMPPSKQHGNASHMGHRGGRVCDTKDVEHSNLGIFSIWWRPKVADGVSCIDILTLLLHLYLHFYFTYTYTSTSLILTLLLHLYLHFYFTYTYTSTSLILTLPASSCYVNKA